MGSLDTPDRETSSIAIGAMFVAALGGCSGQPTTQPQLDSPSHPAVSDTENPTLDPTAATYQPTPQTADLTYEELEQLKERIRSRNEAVWESMDKCRKSLGLDCDWLEKNIVNPYEVTREKANTNPWEVLDDDAYVCGPRAQSASEQAYADAVESGNTEPMEVAEGVWLVVSQTCHDTFTKARKNRIAALADELTR